MDKQTSFHARACCTMCEVVCCTASSNDNFTCWLPPIRCTQRPCATQTAPTMLRVQWTGAGGVLVRGQCCAASGVLSLCRCNLQLICALLPAMSPLCTLQTRRAPMRTCCDARRNARSAVPCVRSVAWARGRRPRGGRALWCPMHLDTGCGAAPLLSLCHRKPTCHRIGTGSLPNRQHPIELRLCDFRARRLVE